MINKTNLEKTEKDLRAKHELIKETLKKNYWHIILNFIDLSESKKVSFINEKSPIWVCWWQGEINMPNIVRICYESICANSGTHPVKLITKDNYSDSCLLKQWR